MGSIPSSPRAAVFAWCQAHTQVFLDNFEDIGLTAEQANTFKTATLNYGSAASAAEAARIASETAFETSRDYYVVMKRLMSQAVTAVRIYADQTNNPEVYALAQVPPRQDPSTVPPPGTPYDMSVELLNPTGAVQLRWKASNPAGGTSYIVRRKLPSENAFSFIGVTGEKRFVDNDFIAGPDSVQYTVQGQRADSAGLQSEIFTVRFGRQGPGANGLTILSASASNAGGAKLAA